MQFLIPGLTVLFVVLKVFEVIEWSWLWVLSPLWIGIPLSFLLFAVVFFGFYKAVEKMKI